MEAEHLLVGFAKGEVGREMQAVLDALGVQDDFAQTVFGDLGDLEREFDDRAVDVGRAGQKLGRIAGLRADSVEAG
jgi:hypothetical protein